MEWRWSWVEVEMELGVELELDNLSQKNVFFFEGFPKLLQN